MDDLTPTQEKFAEWMATPVGDRRPPTYELFAKQYGVSQPTLYRWRKNPNVKARANEIVDEAVGGPERIRMILDKIVEQALQGQAKQQELFLKYAGLLVDRRFTEKVNVLTDVEELSDEELQAEWDLEAYSLLAENDMLEDESDDGE